MSDAPEAMVEMLQNWELHYPVEAMAWSEANPDVAAEAIADALRATLADLGHDDAHNRAALLADLSERYMGWVMGLGIAARRPGHDVLLELLHLDGRVLSRVLRPALVQELSWVVRACVEGDAQAIFELVTGHDGEHEGHQIVAGKLSPGARGVISHALVGCVYDGIIEAETVRDGLDALVVRRNGIVDSKLTLADIMVFNGQMMELLSILPSTDAHLAWLDDRLSDGDVVLDDRKRALELKGLIQRRDESLEVRTERELEYWSRHRARVDHAPAELLERKRPRWVEPDADLDTHRAHPQGATRTADVLFRRSPQGRAAVPHDAWMARLLVLAWDRFSWSLPEIDVARQRRVLLSAPGTLPNFARQRQDELLTGVRAFWEWAGDTYDLPHAADNAASTADTALRLDLDDAFARAAMQLEPDSRTARRAAMTRNKRKRARKKR